MQRYKSQSGSAHAIVIILLVIALVGVLGFVFYQNFIAKKAEVPVVQQVTDQPKTETARLAYSSDLYELDYPKTWKVANKESEGSQEVSITNPDQTVRVTFHISQGGLGGVCDVSDGLKLRYYDVSKNAVTKLTDTPLYVVEAMTDAVDGGYNYVIGLTRDGGETHASLGDPHCTVTYVGVASSVVMDNATGLVTTPTIIAKIDFPKLLTEKTTKVKEMQQVKDLLAADDYKAAVKILESARKS